MTDYKELVADLRDTHNEDRYKRLSLDAANAIEKLLQENTFLKSMQRSMTSSVPLGELGKMVQKSLWEAQHE